MYQAQTVEQLETQMAGIMEVLQQKMGVFSELTEDNQRKISQLAGREGQAQRLEEENAHLRHALQQQAEQVDQLRMSHQISNSSVSSLTPSAFQGNLRNKAENVNRRLVSLREESHDFRVAQQIQSIEDLVTSLTSFAARFVERLENEKPSQHYPGSETTKVTDGMSDCTSQLVPDMDPHDSYYLSRDDSPLEQEILGVEQLAAMMGNQPRFQQALRALRQGAEGIGRELGQSKKAISTLKSESEQNQLYIEKQQRRVQQLKQETSQLSQEKSLLQKQMRDILLGNLGDQTL